MSLQLTTYYKGADLPEALLDVHSVSFQAALLVVRKNKEVHACNGYG